MSIKTDDKEMMKSLADPVQARKAFEQVVSRYSEPLYWKIRRIVVDHDDANDVLQNTFLKAWRSIGDFRQESKLSTWLYRIAINESLDFVRREQKMRNMDGDVSLATRLVADNYFDGDQTQALLQEAIATLPDVQRTVFNLKYFDEMKYSEMSKLMGVTEGALKASYHIAVKKITAYVQRHE
ncbi:MAG: RNA polymerase sigma factor [Prevotella sp.]|nr:RNA polymerase sigma factor [Prevotella sp.]